jgi:hypothetical protein
MAGVQPPVDDFGHNHLSLADVQQAGLGVGSVTGIAFDPEERTVFRAGVFL